MMNYSEAKQILEKQEAAKATLAQYEKLANAHQTYGFQTRRGFIKALQELDKKGGAAKGPARRGTGRRGRGLSEEAVGQIRSLKAEGKSNAEISRTLGVSPLTVGKYVKGAKAKSTKTRGPKAKGTKAKAAKVAKTVKKAAPRKRRKAKKS